MTAALSIGSSRLWQPFLVCLVLTTGCRPSSPQAVRSAPDALRIVSTMPSTTEMLHRFGVWDAVVGTSIFCDVPPAAQALPQIGSGMDPDVERILSLAPTLVVGSIVQADYAFVSSLREAGIEVLLVQDQGFEALLGDMPRLGRAVGAEARAREVVESIRADISHIGRVAAGGPAPRVLLLFATDPIYAAGPDTFINALLEAAGGENVLEHGDWNQLDLEAVVRLTPEVILHPAGGANSPALSIAQRWSGLGIPAIDAGRVYALREPGISRPGPGIAEATREIAETLFPDLDLTSPPTNPL